MKTNPALPEQFVRPLAGISAFLLAVSCGCSTMKVPEFKVQETSSYQYTAQTNGLLLAVQPVTDKKQIKETFNIDLLGKGIVPILVVVENKTSSSFLFAKEKAVVAQANFATNATNLGQKLASGSGAEATVNTGAAFLGVAIFSGPAVVVAAPLLIGGMKAMSNADIIRHNLADKALASHTIEPGNRAYGYLYFELPKGAKFEGGHQVVLELTDTKSDQPLTFVFNVQ
jgi:hypothetical protein